MITLLILLAGLQVHEWGVIMNTPNTTISSFTPSELEEMAYQQDFQLEDKAPVMYFHGDTCTVTIRISTPNMGYITTAIPEPNEGGVNSTFLLWEELQLSTIGPEIMQEGWATCEDLNYNVDAWRDVEALTVVNNGRFDKFIYYDCVPGNPGDLPFISESGNQSFRLPYGEIPCIVLTVAGGNLMYGSFTLADITTSIPKGLRFVEDIEVLKREVRRLSAGTLFDDEFDAFWNCWETELLTAPNDGTLILYKVPEEIINQIATLEVIPNRDIQVDIHRFILAVLPYRTE